jgi:hypothetical protein
MSATPAHTYEPSRHLLDFHVAGFAYYDGLAIAQQLKIGQTVQLIAEPDNPYDPQAIAIYYHNTKIGYVPKDHNDLLSRLLYFGYQTIFEAHIQMIDWQQHPERQLRVVVQIKDHREAQ